MEKHIFDWLVIVAVSGLLLGFFVIVEGIVKLSIELYRGWRLNHDIKKDRKGLHKWR